MPCVFPARWLIGGDCFFAGYARFARLGAISFFSGCAGVAGQVLHDGVKVV